MMEPNILQKGFAQSEILGRATAEYNFTVNKTTFQVWHQKYKLSECLFSSSSHEEGLKSEHSVGHNKTKSNQYPVLF